MRLLIIEDDKQLSTVLSLQLQHEGFEVDCIQNASDAMFYALQKAYDVILLDRMLPGMDGLTILKILRENRIQTPIILATALDSVDERINGLNCGADDYIVKPYDVGELIARIYALSRRPSNWKSTRSLTFGDLTFHPSEGNLCVHEGKIHLSKRETLLMECFLKNPQQTLTRQFIFTRIWGIDGAVEDGNLDTYIYYLRKHLRSLKSSLQITTVHGTGYRMEEVK